MRSRRLVTPALAASFLVAACSGGETVDSAPVSDLAFADGEGGRTTTTSLLIDGAPDVSLEQREIELVLFEASWVCELQRRTFTSPDAMQAALEEKLDAAGVDRSVYDQFRTDVSNSQDLRDSILFAYQESCRL